MFTPQVIVLTVLMFFLLVGIHEFGHFIFAKRAGILVREFAIGFGPKIFSYKKGETRYTIGILPFGGFVRMAGEDPEVVQINPGQNVALKLDQGKATRIYLDRLDQRYDVVMGIADQVDLEKRLILTLDVDGDTQTYDVHPEAIMVHQGKEIQIAPLNRQFASKTVRQRAMAIFAGPMMNFFLAFALFLLYWWISGTPEHIKLEKIVSGSPAQKAELQTGDVILSVNGEKIGADRDKFVSLIGASKNQEMIWQIKRGDAVKTIKVTPREEKNGQIMVGVQVGILSRSATIKEIVTGAWDSMVYFTEEIFKGLKRLVTLNVKMDDLAGPVGMVEVTGQIANMGIAYLVKWTALLSLYLGIFNLLPFPALDGSRLMFIGIEGLRGKPVDPARESMVHFIGFAMLMLLMIVVTYNDILRLFKG